MKKLFKWVGIIFGCLVVIGMVSNAMKSPEQKQAEAAALEQQRVEQAAAEKAKVVAELAAMPVVTASAIASAYDANTVAADQQFKGKKFKVSGTVADINTNFMGQPYVTLRGGVNQFMEPQFAFEKSDAEQLVSLKKVRRLPCFAQVKAMWRKFRCRILARCSDLFNRLHKKGFIKNEPFFAFGLCSFCI